MGDEIITFEVRIYIQSKPGAPQHWLKECSTLDEVDSVIKRMRVAYEEYKKRPMPKQPESYAELIRSEYPATEFAYTVVKVTREVISEHEEKVE
jgi:hypothetical protein